MSPLNFNQKVDKVVRTLLQADNNLDNTSDTYSLELNLVIDELRMDIEKIAIHSDMESWIIKEFCNLMIRDGDIDDHENWKLLKKEALKLK